MGLEDAGCRARFLIGERDGKFPALFDAVPTDAGIEVVLSGVQMPRMNAITERWVQTDLHRWDFRRAQAVRQRQLGI